MTIEHNTVEEENEHLKDMVVLYNNKHVNLCVAVKALFMAERHVEDKKEELLQLIL